MPVPALGQEDALEIRVSGELDAHQVVGLALLVVGAREHAHDARQRLAVVDPRAQAQAARGAGCAVEQLVGDREAPAGGAMTRPSPRRPGG
jgi:hypothetical protein